MSTDRFNAPVYVCVGGGGGKRNVRGREAWGEGWKGKR